MDFAGHTRIELARPEDFVNPAGFEPVFTFEVDRQTYTEQLVQSASAP